MERREIGEQKVGPRFLGIGLRGYFGICVKKAGIFRALRVLRGKIFVGRSRYAAGNSWDFVLFD